MIRNEIKNIRELSVENYEGTNIRQTINDNILDNIARYRADWNYFNETYLDIKDIVLFQKMILTTVADNDVIDVIASRGLSKSFITALCALDIALLYPKSEILVVSKTIGQANLIITEKIKNGFCAKGTKFASPVLVQMRKDNYIRIVADDYGCMQVIFGNGSTIKAIVCGEGGRGNRATCIIIDEFMLVALKDYNEIIRPTLHPRENSVHNEPARQIFLSSARRKSSWGYTHLKHCINNHYKNKEIKYGFFLGDVFTAVCNGILNKKQYIQAKEASDPQSFAQEYLNEFLGSSEDGIYKYEDFEKNQVVENAFQPTTVQDLIDGNKNNWAFNDNEIRWLSCDLAVATGELNDNTVLILTSLNLDTGIKRVVYINTLSGVSSIEQVKIMKRLFYDFKCQYFVFDSKGLGNVIYDLLTVETFDEEFQRTYPAWNVNTDASLQISSDVVIQDKVDRTITSNCINCIIPIAATAEINSNLHLALRKALKDGEIQLLIDDYDKKSNLQQEDELFMLKDANEKAEILLPFVQTRYLINEAMSLEVKINENGLIRLHEAKRTQTKDRYMALTYANMFGDKLINKYLKSNDDDDIDFDELNLVF